VVVLAVVAPLELFHKLVPSPLVPAAAELNPLHGLFLLLVELGGALLQLVALLRKLKLNRQLKALVVMSCVVVVLRRHLLKLLALQ
jgi:hypothetical protein